MANINQNEKKLIEYFKVSCSYLKEIVDIISEAHVKIAKLAINSDNNDEINMALFPLTTCIIDSYRSYYILSSNRCLRDAYVSSRTILETILNTGYIACEGVSAAEKAVNHARQKTYRDLDRILKTKHLEIHIGVKDFKNLNVDKDLQKAIDYYTTTKGKENRKWDEKSTFAKIEIIHDTFGDDISGKLTWALFHIYRYASEVAHGTVFNALHMAGLTKQESIRPKNANDYSKHNYFELALLNQTTMIMGYCIIVILNKYYPLQISVEKWTNLSERFKKERIVKKILRAK